MQIRGPLATLLAVVVAGAAVVATNLVLTDGPAPERTASLGLSRSSDSYGADDGDGYGGGDGGGDAYGGAAAPGAGTPAPQTGGAAAPDAAASDAATPAPASYDGRSSGNEVTVALKVEDGGAAAAYVCDGKGVESWMRGTVEGTDLKLTGKNGATLDGRTQDGAAFGTVQVGGKSWPFAAAPPKKKAPSGDAPTGGWS